MTQQPTPHQAPPAALAAAQYPRSAGTAVMWTTAALGGLMILGIGASAAYGAATSVSGTTGAGGVTTVSAEGIADLDLDISTADFTLAYGPVTEATLEVTGTRSEQWGLRRDSDSLVVRAPGGVGGSCWFGFCPPDRNASATATLTLPQELKTRALDADVTVGVGTFTADGTFASIEIELGAGTAHVKGAAEALDVSVGVGTFTGEFTGVRRADLVVSMGELDTRLRGDAPDSIGIEVGIGSALIEVPDVEYRFDLSSSLGDVQNSLRNNPSADREITADVGMGDLTLRPGA